MGAVKELMLLRKQEVLAIHERAIREFGGAGGIRDEGALESAIVAADNRLWYEQADAVACAATYAYHLTMAHAFVDGKKRVAAATTRSFLFLNDVELNTSEDDLCELFMAIVSGEMSRDAVDSWLRDRLQP